MNAAGTGSREADSQSSRVLAICASHKGGGFFMANLDESDRFRPALQRFHYSIDAIPRKTKNSIHSPFGEFLNE